MTEQKCVRTYEVKYSGYQMNPCAEVNCKELNSYLECGWKVVFITLGTGYIEYIIEREVDNSRNGVEK